MAHFAANSTRFSGFSAQESEDEIGQASQSVNSKMGYDLRAPTGILPLGANDGGRDSHQQKRGSLRYGKTMQVVIDANPMRRRLSELMSTQRYEAFTGAVILLNFVVITLETDARQEAGEGDVDKLFLYYIANTIFLFFYTVECVIRFYVLRCRFFHHAWNLFDLVIVLVGIVSLILQQVLDSDTGDMNLFRSMRMIRLLRLPRLLISFQELYTLICGLTNCIRTLFWASALIFLLLTIYAIIAVEYVHPLMSALEEEGHYTMCTWCPGAFSSIMHANLTFFQIVSGDSWSFLARALIEKHPWTAIMFISVILTVVFGLLNLVVAAIVETAAQAREKDLINASFTKQKERDQAWTNFANLVLELDNDENGEVTVTELRDGISKIPELYALLSVMGVTADDVIALFDVLDDNGDGVVTLEEFTTQLFKMRTSNHATNTYYIKHYVEDVRQMVMKNTDVLNILCRQGSLMQSEGGGGGGLPRGTLAQRQTRAVASGGRDRRVKPDSSCDVASSDYTDLKNSGRDSKQDDDAEDLKAPNSIDFVDSGTSSAPLSETTAMQGRTRNSRGSIIELEDLVTTLTTEMQGLRGSLEIQMEDMTRELSELRDLSGPAAPPSHPGEELSKMQDLHFPSPPPPHPSEDGALHCSSAVTNKAYALQHLDNRDAQLEVSVGPSSAPSRSRCCRMEPAR